MSEKINQQLQTHGAPGYKPEDFGLDQDYVNEKLEEIFRGGRNDGSFLYKRATKNASGGQKFEHVANSSVYKNHVTKVEKEIFEKEKESLRKIFAKSRKNIIELGPGGGDKFFEIIADGYDIRNKGYVGVDVSAYSLEKAKQYADQRYIKYILLLNDRGEEKIYNDNEGVILYLGGSIGNLEDMEIVHLLEEFTFGSQRDVVISHFVAPEGEGAEEKIQELIDSYKTPEVEDFILSGFASLGIDTSKLELAVDYIKGQESTIRTSRGSDELHHADKIVVGARLKENMVIELNRRGKVIKEKGECIRAISSRRFTQAQFEKIAKMAGCKHIDTYSKQGLAISVIRTPPAQRLKKFIRDNKKRISNTLLIGAVAGGIGYMVSDAKYQKKQEKISQARQSELYGREVSDDKTSLELIATISEDISETIQKAQNILRDRYGWGDVDGYEGKVLMGLLRKYFIDMDKNEFNTLRMYHQGLSWKVDKFVQEYKAPILEGGYNVVPNAFLQKYPEHIKNTFMSDEEVKVTHVLTNAGKGVTSAKTITSNKKYIAERDVGNAGVVYGAQFTYDLARITLNGKKCFVAKLHGLKNDDSGYPYKSAEYSLELGRQAVIEYLDGGYLHEVAERIVLAMYKKLNINSLNPETWTPRIEEILLQARVEGYDFSLFLNDNIPIEYVLNTFIFLSPGEKLENIAKDTDGYREFGVPLHASELEVKDICNDVYDLRAVIESVLTVLNEDYDEGYMESLGDTKQVEEQEYPEVRNSIFKLLAASRIENVHEKLSTRLAINQRLEKNSELFNSFGYKIFPFKKFEEHRSAFERTVGGKDSELIGRNVILPRTIGLYTTLQGERFNVSLSADSKNHYILAYPLNNSAIHAVNKIRQSYLNKFSLLRFGKPFSQLGDMEKKITVGSAEYQFEHSNAIVGQYVAEDFFKQEQLRNLQPKDVSGFKFESYRDIDPTVVNE